MAALLILLTINTLVTSFAAYVAPSRSPSAALSCIAGLPCATADFQN